MSVPATCALLVLKTVINSSSLARVPLRYGQQKRWIHRFKAQGFQLLGPAGQVDQQGLDVFCQPFERGIGGAKLLERGDVDDEPAAGAQRRKRGLQQPA